MNQLITREKDRGKLIQGVCDTLIKTRGYYNAWIALLDEPGKLAAYAESGLGKDFLPMVKKLKRGELTTCAREALGQPEIILTKDPYSTCTDCSLAKIYGGRGAATVRLEAGGKIFGILSASAPAAFIADEEEGVLFKEVSRDIALALQNIELEGERKRAEEALRRIEQEKIAILDSMSEVVVFQDMEHRLIWANKAAGESMDTPPAQLAGRYCYEVWHQRSEPCVGCPITKAIETDQPQQGEMTTPDGRVWFVGGYPVRDANGDIMGIVESVLDITERKRAKEELETSRAQMQAILDGSPDGIRQVDTDLKILWANKATLARNPEALGQTCYKAMVNRDKPCEGCPSLHAMQTGKIERGVIYQPASRGVSGECYWEGIGVPLKDDEGKIIGAIQIIRDVTDRKRAEEALRESENFRSSLLANSPHPIIVVNPDTSVRYVNPALERLTGFPSAEIVGGKAPYPWWTEETLQKTSRDFEKAMHQGRIRREKLFQKENGQRFWVEITSTPVIQDGEFKHVLYNKPGNVD
ncbi:hypothetical protein ES703_88668 [subsurface metagenome]